MDVLVCFHPSVRLHLFDPHSNVLPHTSCSSYPPRTSVSCQGPQAASLPSFHSFSSPPVRILCKSPSPGRQPLCFPPACSCFMFCGAQRRSARSCQSCILPSGLHWEMLSSFFKSTQPTAARRRKTQLSCFRCITNPGMPGQVAGKLALLVRSWLRWF